MPKLKFQYADNEVEFEMHKVDRSRLYGYKQQEALDENGDRCELSTLANDGRTLIGKGGTGIGYVDADGNWCDKAALRPVDLQGESITPVPSSFSAPIHLENEATLEEFLDHNIRLIYELESNAINGNLAAKLTAGTIFMFPYSYRGGLEADGGFLLANNDDVIFFLVGDDTKVEMKSLQTATLTPDDTSDDEPEDDLMSFDMI